jgi:MOSC domain-containing protein YiiM
VISAPVQTNDETAPVARVISVNVGRPKEIDTGSRTVSTAIWKEPVEGPVRVDGVNVSGDDQADRSVHGGPDKAVYAYASEEIAHWQHELGRDLGNAPFGENLTTEGIDVSGAFIGERWRIGSTVLEVVQPRLPCFKLGLRLGDPALVRRFAQASRPGAYLRIIEPGELSAGDAIAVETESLPEHGVTMRMVSDAILLDPRLIPQVLEAPGLLPSLREWMTVRIS